MHRFAPGSRMVAAGVIALTCASVLSAQLTYPAPYRSLKLPEPSGATITSTGRQATSLRDGIRIELQTPAGVQDVLAFYRQGMAPLGWSETPPKNKFQSPMLGRAEFTKGALVLDVMATRLGTATRVTVNLLEK